MEDIRDLRDIRDTRGTRTALGWGWFLLINVCSSPNSSALPGGIMLENEHFPGPRPQEAALGSQGGSLVGGVTHWIPIPAPALHRKDLIHSSVPQVHNSYLY